MTKHTFNIELAIDATLVLDDAVLNAVNDEWRGTFYNLQTWEAIAEHIAYNLIINKRELNQLDGWADQPASNATVELDDVEVASFEQIVRTPNDNDAD